VNGQIGMYLRKMNRTFAATGAVLILVLALREPSQSQTPSPTAEATAAPEAKAQPNSSSVSPDQKWGYAEEDGPKLVKAGTNEVALDLDGFGGLLWAPDSKRFACDQLRFFQRTRA
jgi:hypothetical protein